jgi:uncharacterized protein DUF6982/PilZ domain-containing protein
MSPAELLLDTTEEVLPFSQRLVQRRLAQPIEPVAIERPQDRRAHARRPATDLEWLESVRLSGGTGYGVKLIDLSEGGALVEVDAPLRPGVRLTLELAGGGLDASVPLQVLRSYIARLKGDSTFYRGACAFAHAIDLPFAKRAAPRRTPFVGAGAALQYLLDRSTDSASRVALARPDLLQVLESIHTRGDAAGGAVGRGTLELLGAVLPALQRGASRDDAAAALECRYRTLPRDVQADLREAARTLEALIGRCFPDPPAPAPLAAPAIAEPAPASTPPLSAKVASAMQKIVVRYVDGDLIKGFTHDFHPSRAQFSLWPSVNAAPSERVVVPLSRLKAVFFVRDFNGNPGYRERKTFMVRGQGRRIEVTFADTEVILGTTLNYRPDGLGFFVAPADPGANNSRIFVVASAVKRVRFL